MPGAVPTDARGPDARKARRQVEGSLLVPAAGTLTIVFDNSYSMMTGKQARGAAASYWPHTHQPATVEGTTAQPSTAQPQQGGRRASWA